MNEAEVFAALEAHDALRRGHFVLSSGRHSDTYVQCARVLQWPRLAERFGHDLGTRFAGERATVVLSPAVGGIVIGQEVARQLGVRAVFCERVDGAMTLRRGLELGYGDRVVVAEDVVTTGGSPREALELARARGAEPIGVASIVDRSGGTSFGLRFESLCRIAAGTWEPDACPLCAEGGAAESPGSRRLPEVGPARRA